jgi:hypothetical protein
MCARRLGLGVGLASIASGLCRAPSRMGPAYGIAVAEHAVVTAAPAIELAWLGLRLGSR